MEIRSVVQTHTRDALDHTVSRTHLLSFDIRTHQGFDNSRLEYGETEHWALVIAFDVDARPDLDRIVYVDAEQEAAGDHALYGVVTGGRERHDLDEGRWAPMRRMLAYARVERPSSDVVRVSFPAAALGTRSFRWRVRMVWCRRAAHEECAEIDVDYAPPLRMHRSTPRSIGEAGIDIDKR